MNGSGKFETKYYKVMLSLKCAELKFTIKKINNLKHKKVLDCHEKFPSLIVDKNVTRVNRGSLSHRASCHNGSLKTTIY